MRNEDLKNKLDHRPIDFDREDLWNKIETRSNRKNRAFIWWCLGGLILIASGSIYTFYYLQSKVYVTSNEVDVVQNDTYNIDQSKNSRNVVEQEKQPELTEQTAVEATSAKRAQVNVIKDELVRIQTGTQTSSIEREIKDENREVVNTEVETITSTSQISLLSDLRDVDVISVKEKDLLDYRKVQFELLRKIDFSSIIHNRVKIANVNNQIFRPKQNALLPSKNILALNVGVGADFHSFQLEDNYRRSEIESNLESVASQVSYQRFCTENWVLSFALGFTTSQTKTELVSIEDGQYTRSLKDGNTYIETTETSRKLYNRYSRWDVDISVGYQINFGLWRFTPYIGRGININTSSSGDVIDLDNRAISFTDLSIYHNRTKGYWAGVLKFDRAIGDDLRLGLLSRFESSRILTRLDHQHSVRPSSVRLQLEWLW